MYCRRGGANLDRMTVVIRRSILIVSAALTGLLLLACGGTTDEPRSTDAASGALTTAEAPAATPSEASGEVAATSADGLPYATGPAAVVAAGYEPPDDRVDSTGAYLPANGKPTLVFVDAIW